MHVRCSYTRSRAWKENLTEAERKQLQVLLVSFAPTWTPIPCSKRWPRKQEVDETRWRLVRTNESSVRELSAVLGISYRKLDDGNYNHASVLTLLDRNRSWLPSWMDSDRRLKRSCKR